MSELYKGAGFSRADLLKYGAAGLATLLLGQAVSNDVAGASEKPFDVAAEFSKRSSWEENFADSKNGKPNSKIWNYTIGNTVPGYNDEAETYTDHLDNVRVEDGMLIFEARHEHFDDRDYTSGRLDTQGKFGFTHGKFEVDLILPSGVGTWPAVWFLPTKPRYKPSDYGLGNNGGNNWLLNGEIDGVETVGTETEDGRDLIYPDIHTVDWDKAQNNNPNPYHHRFPGITEDFNRFGVEKLADRITFTHNSKPYHTIYKTSDSPLSWPFEQEFFPILNLAMGGSWAGKIAESEFPPDGIDNSKAPWIMKVKSIAYYPLLSVAS